MSDGDAGTGPLHPDRRRALTAGAAGLVSLVLPSATAAASGETLAPASVTALTFSDVSTTGFTVSWAAVV